MSFALLCAVVLGAILIGNFVVDDSQGCRSLGSPTENQVDPDSLALIVYSNELDGLVLCDVPNESANYKPPPKSYSGTPFLTIVVEDQHGNRPGFASRGNEGQTLLYLKGEFGDVEDCGPLDRRSYESDDFDGFDGLDMFHPDRIQSCWNEFVILPDDEE